MDDEFKIGDKGEDKFDNALGEIVEFYSSSVVRVKFKNEDTDLRYLRTLNKIFEEKQNSEIDNTRELDIAEEIKKSSIACI